MLKTLKRKMLQDKQPLRIPRSVQEVLPVDRVWANGIFQCGDGYSKTFRFDDVNYSVASKEDKKAMFLGYSELLNAMDAGATYKISIINRRFDEQQFRDSILMPEKTDGHNALRGEYNSILRNRKKDTNGIVQEKYLTVSIAKKNVDAARAALNRMGETISQNLKALQSRSRPLDCAERLRMLYNFLRQGEPPAFFFDHDTAMRYGIPPKDFIAPDTLEFRTDHFVMGDVYARVLNLRIDASFLRDEFISDLCDLNKDMVLSIDLVPMPTDEAVREMQNILLGVETTATNWQRKQNANNNYIATLPYDVEQQRTETREMLDDLTARDQRMFEVIVTLIHTAENIEQLDSDTEALQAVARQNLCQLAMLKYQQKEGFQTVLPFGVTRLNNCYRTLTTEGAAIMMPFKVQDIAHPHGIYLGQNVISKNLIMYNRAQLLNPSAFWLGVPGSGKSMGAKFEMLEILLNCDNDDILCCDPENEYDFVRQLGGEVIRIAAGSPHHINALDMEEGYGDSKDPVIDKSQFVMSMFEQLVGGGKLGPREKSILDRCVRRLYERAAKDRSVPCLPDLHRALLQQKEPEAHGLALACELFSTGSLDTFAHPTNVDVHNRMVVYDIHDLGKQLKTLGMLVVTDAMLNRVARNFQEGRRTHLYFDEFHVVFDHENSSNFFVSAWRQFRKRNAYVNGITQNVEYLLESAAARSLVGNSEFVVMYNQAASDRAELAQLLQISNRQMSYVTNAQAGNGLAKIGGALVPFQNQIPEDTQLYKLLTTKPTDKRS